MTLSQQEFSSILADNSKRIDQDIRWTEDENHSPSLTFRAAIESAGGHDLLIVGRYNPFAGKLSYSLILGSVGRVYGLDLGADHRNPDGNLIGEKHKHRWTDRFRDKEAYVPEDITEPWNHPVEVWTQFCVETHIAFASIMHPPDTQMELPL
jgi:hypothetical protein